MGHMLDIRKGQAAVFSAREAMWHGLGTITEGALTAPEALKVALLDWRTEMLPCLALDAQDGENWQGVILDTVTRELDLHGTAESITKALLEKLRAVETASVTGRRVDGQLDIWEPVGGRYKPLHNVEAFDFMDLLLDAYVAEGAERPVYETAGSLKGGRVVFMSAAFPEDLVLDPGGREDVIRRYLVATNGHDGNRAARFTKTPIRPVCWNTVTYGESLAERSISFVHTDGIQGKLGQARRALGLFDQYDEMFAAEASVLIETDLTKRAFDKFLTEAYPVPKEGDVAPWVITSRLEQHDGIRKLYETAETNANITGTAWGAVQAATEFADWVRPVKAPKGQADQRRLENSFLNGAGIMSPANEAKAAAFDYARETWVKPAKKLTLKVS